MTIIVRFSSPAEYIAELRQDKVLQYGPKVQDQVVRVTKVWQPTKATPNVQIVSVVATAYVVPSDGRGEAYILTLDHLIGQDWGHDNQVSTETRNNADELVAKLEKNLKELGYDVRAGVMEPGEAPHG